MTMLGHVRGATEKSRRSDSNASSSTKPVFSLTPHSQSTRSNTSVSHPSSNVVRSGHGHGHTATTAATTTNTGSTTKGTGFAQGSAQGTHAELGAQARKHGSTHQHVDRIEEEYEGSGRPQEEPRRHHNHHHHHAHSNHTQHNGSAHLNNGNNSNSNSNSSSFSRNDVNSAAMRGTQMRAQNGSGISNSGPSTADTNFRAGMKLIQQAYEDKYQALVDEVNTWKWISEEQSAQMTTMAGELARVEDSYAALQKEMGQLEMFRKAIVSMVDQHSGVSLTQLEQSILETIEADADNGDTGYNAVADADTSSFMLDDDAESSANQSRFIRDDLFSREQKPSSNGLGAVSTSFKSSPQLSSPRPRASTEASTKKPGSTHPSSRSSNQGGYSPLRQGGSSATRSVAAVLSDSLPNRANKMTKSDSADSLRSKRNTISTSSTSSSRPIYPNAPLTNGTSKRHSSVSPLSPRARAIISSSRVAPASTSFSSNSTPSSSPRQPTSASTAASSTAGSIAARTARQYQQQKEYSINVRNSMSQMASLSGVSAAPPTSLGDSDRRQVVSETPSGLHSKSGSTNMSQTTTKHRSQRSGSDSLSTSGLSPAALKLIRQQEQQQQLEEEEEDDYVPKSSGHTRHGSHQHTEDEDHRRSVARSVANGSARSHHRKPSESGHESVSHAHASGYESGSKYQKPDSHAGVAVNGTTSQSQRSSGGVDASAFTMLYKEIRDSMDALSFGMFARVVTAFNEGDKTTEETLDEVGKIVKDRALNQRFRDLIHQAIAEKEIQMESSGGNETMEADRTMEIDQSLLLDDDKEITDAFAAGGVLELEQEREHEDLTRYSLNDEHGLGMAQDADESVFALNPEESLLETTERTHLDSEKILDMGKEIMSGDEGRVSNEEKGISPKTARKQTI